MAKHIENYTSIHTGPQIDEGLSLALGEDNIATNGWIKLKCDAENPVDLDQVVSLGNYTVSFHTHGHADMVNVTPLNISVVMMGDSKIQMAQLGTRSYSRPFLSTTSTYGPWTFSMNSSYIYTQPLEPETTVANALWICTANPDKPEFRMKTPTGWKVIRSDDAMSAAVYDPTGKKTDLFKYAADKAKESQLMEDPENPGTTIDVYEKGKEHIVDTIHHITQAEREAWNAKASVAQMNTSIADETAILKKAIDDKGGTAGGQITTLQDTLNTANTTLTTHVGNADIHVTPANKTEWSGKAAGDHTHIKDDRVEIDASKITSGILDLARIPSGAIEDFVEVASEADMLKLTKTDVQNGDSIVMKTAPDLIALPTGPNYKKGDEDLIQIAYMDGIFVRLILKRNTATSTLVSEHSVQMSKNGRDWEEFIPIGEVLKIGEFLAVHLISAKFMDFTIFLFSFEMANGDVEFLFKGYDSSTNTWRTLIGAAQVGTGNLPFTNLVYDGNSAVYILGNHGRQVYKITSNNTTTVTPLVTLAEGQGIDHLTVRHPDPSDPSKILLVGISAAARKIKTSPDGITWTDSSFEFSVDLTKPLGHTTIATGIIDSAEFTVILTENTKLADDYHIIYTIDGTNWKSLHWHTPYADEVHYVDGMFLLYSPSDARPTTDLDMKPIIYTSDFRKFSESPLIVKDLAGTFTGTIKMGTPWIGGNKVLFSSYPSPLPDTSATAIQGKMSIVSSKGIKAPMVKNTYAVIDDTKLGTMGAFREYASGEAQSVNWTNIQSKPTTLSGYGITDSLTTSQMDAQLTSNINQAKTYTDQKVTEASNLSTKTMTSTNSPVVTFINGQFLLLPSSNSNILQISADGVTWKTVTLPTAGYWRAGAGDGDKEIILISGSISSSTNNAVVSKDNGATWTASTLPSSTRWISIAHGTGHNYLACAYNSTSGAYTTNGGTTWTSTLIVPTTTPASNNACVSVAWGRYSGTTQTNGNYVAWVNGWTVATTDGSTYSTTANPPSSGWAKGSPNISLTVQQMIHTENAGFYFIGSHPDYNYPIVRQLTRIVGLPNTPSTTFLNIIKSAGGPSVFPDGYTRDSRCCIMKDEPGTIRIIVKKYTDTTHYLLVDIAEEDIPTGSIPISKSIIAKRVMETVVPTANTNTIYAASNQGIAVVTDLTNGNVLRWAPSLTDVSGALTEQNQRLDSAKATVDGLAHVTIGGTTKNTLDVIVTHDADIATLSSAYGTLKTAVQGANTKADAILQFLNS